MTIQAEFSSATMAAVIASTIAVHIGSPILALCHKLITAGYPPFDSIIQKFQSSSRQDAEFLKIDES
jgi:hypothetical protein